MEKERGTMTLSDEKANELSKWLQYATEGRHMEHVEDLTIDDEFFAPFDEVLGDAGLLVMALEDLRVHGRVWSIGHTKAEDLLAWLKYAMNQTAQERMADQDREANGLQRVAVL